MGRVLSRESENFIHEYSNRSDIYLEWVELNEPIGERTGEQRLIAALLDRAVRDIAGTKDVYRLNNGQLVELMEWALLARTDEPFGMRWCCSQLGYDATVLGRWFVYWATRRGIRLPRRPWMFEVRELDEEADGFFCGVAESIQRRSRPRAVKFYD